MWLSLHGLRINLVVFLIGAEKADHHHAVLTLHHGDQAIIIRLDVKDHPAGFEGRLAGEDHIEARTGLEFRSISASVTATQLAVRFGEAVTARVRRARPLRITGEANDCM
jgi:hypothetical protein